jgi:hypothetical protein
MSETNDIHDSTSNGTTNDAATADATVLDLDVAPDITSVEEQGATISILSADGKKVIVNGRPVTMTVLGSYSKTYRRTQSAQRERMLRTRRSSLTDELLEKNRADLAAACVTGWDGFLASGQPVPFTRENVLKVFAKFPFIFDQVWEEIHARENFSARSLSSSAST